MRYKDNLGNVAIEEMTLLEAINECSIRMNLLDKYHLNVRKEADPRVYWIFGQPYTVFQFIHFAETDETTEFATAILVNIRTQKIVPLDFDCFVENHKHESKAHQFLDTLRELCAENNLRTETELQVLLEQQYRTY